MKITNFLSRTCQYNPTFGRITSKITNRKSGKVIKKLINLLALTGLEEKLDGKKITNNKIKNVKIMIIKF
jgi:hypothetical protein